jgi:hypothetical protein
VQHDGDEHEHPQAPQQRHVALQQRGILIHGQRPTKDQDVAEHVPDDPAGEDHARHRHHRFLADRVAIEPGNHRHARVRS